MRKGTRVGQAYIALTVDGSDINREIGDSVDNATDQIGEAGERGGAEYGEHFSDGFLARMRARMPNVTKALGERLGSSGRDMGTDLGDSVGESFSDRMSTRARETADRVTTQMGERLRTRQESVRRGVQSAFSDDFADRIATRFADRISETMGDRLEMMLAHHQQFIEENTTSSVSGNAGRGPSTAGGRNAGLGALVGGILGAGSRNNALNLLGKSVGGTITLLGKFASVAKGASETFIRGFTQAAETAGTFRSLAAGGGAVGSAALQSLAKNGPTAAAALVAVGGAMILLVSVGSALLGIVTALASTIVSALVGALAVGSGAMLAAVAAGGLLTAAFMSMTDAQKNLLKDAFTPLKEEMVGIGQLMITQMVPAFDTWSRNLQNALALLAPVASVMGGAFARAGNILTASFSGPGFQRVAHALGVYLPGIVTKMSSALGGFLNGAAGLFAAILPSVDRFAGYLSRVAAEFSDWANSTSGQNAIVDFVDRAVDSLMSLWDFVTEFSGFLSDVLFSSEAQGAGNSIFDSLADAFSRFRDKVEEWIENGDLEKWFNDAVDFGEDLAMVVSAIADIIGAMNSSGMLTLFGAGLMGISQQFKVFADAIRPVIWSLDTMANLAERALNIMGMSSSMSGGYAGNMLDSLRNPRGGAGASSIGSLLGGGGSLGLGASGAVGALIGSGASALGQTSKSSGGYKPDKKNGPAAFVNPYKKWAESLIKDGPSTAAEIRKAARAVGVQIREAMRDAAKMLGRDAVDDAMASLSDQLKQSAANTVDNARQGLNSAAQALAGASNMKAANAALAKVKKAQRDLKAAQRDQRRIDRAAALVDRQGNFSRRRRDDLLKGLNVQNATLADFASARAVVAERLEAAKVRLEEAIALRDNYRTQVADSIKAFGALTTAQAAVINGIEQSLTSTDITTNLQDRLAKITAFQENLRVLLGRGLSEDAYKQILDQGVEGGSAYAQALVNGTAGSIQQVNDLVGKINSAADTLGLESSNRLYQAGVDAAKGLVDGLNSLSGQLDAAATRLGNSIAAAVKKSLGIKSPSRVMMGYMDAVGDGMALGLDNQHGKVGTAASALSAKVAVSPEVARWAASRSESGSEVSGNPKVLWTGNLITPTEDPHAVANETLNELTGRL